MDNFDLNKIASKVKLQKREADKVVKKKSGRPRIIPKARLEIKIDKALRAKLRKFDSENGNRGVSNIVVPLIKGFLKEKGYD